MDTQRNLPNADRLSVFSATLLLAYALARLIQLPSGSITLQGLGIGFTFPFGFSTLVSLLVAVLAAAGMDWLIGDHPAIRRRQQPWWVRVAQHSLLPMLTAWLIGVPLSSLPEGPAWWAVFFLGGALLLLVFVAEYIVVDPEDVRAPMAAAGLTALSFALFLMLAIAVRSNGWRLYLALPTLAPAAGLVALRTLHLRVGGRWLFAWSVGVMIVVGQVAVGLHYLPATPVDYGLALLAPAYAITHLAATYEEGAPRRRWLGETAAWVAVFAALLAWVR